MKRFYFLTIAIVVIVAVVSMFRPVSFSQQSQEMVEYEEFDYIDSVHIQPSGSEFANGYFSYECSLKFTRVS